VKYEPSIFVWNRNNMSSRKVRFYRVNISKLVFVGHSRILKNSHAAFRDDTFFVLRNRLYIMCKIRHCSYITNISHDFCFRQINVRFRADSHVGSVCYAFDCEFMPCEYILNYVVGQTKHEDIILYGLRNP